MEKFKLGELKMNNIKFKKCLKCNNIIEVITKCNSDNKIICCENEMVDIIPNSAEASFEKHLPVYELDESNIKIRVNHVMESDHYIAWILVKGKNKVVKKDFNENDIPELLVPYEKGSFIYSYCNKHGLWKTVVK